MIEAVLFDFGLVLSGPPAPAAWARMLEVTGLTDELFRPAYWAPRHAYDRGTHTGAQYWRATGTHAGVDLDEAQVAALIDADTELWTQWNEPMVNWAARLRAAGTRTGILSNLGDAMETGVMERMPWLAEFDHRVFSHRLKLAKPELEIYRHAAERLETAPENILFVDDREDNCAGGISAGMQVIQYREHEEFVTQMERRGWGELWRSGRLN